MAARETRLLIPAAILLIASLLLWFSGQNQALFLALNSATSVLPDFIWANLTLIADTLFAVAVLLVAACYQPKLFAQALILLVLGALFTHGFKQGLNIPRPFSALGEGAFHVIGPELKHHSFPSGHSFTALAAAGLLMLHLKKGFSLVLTIGLLAAFSRVAVGAHWLLDVLVGAGFGLLFALLADVIYRRVRWTQSKAMERTAALLFTMSSIALLFHDDRYPDTQLFGVLMGLFALWVVFKEYWVPMMRK